MIGTKSIARTNQHKRAGNDTHEDLQEERELRCGANAAWLDENVPDSLRARWVIGGRHGSSYVTLKRVRESGDPADAIYHDRIPLDCKAFEAIMKAYMRDLDRIMELEARLCEEMAGQKGLTITTV